MPVTLEVSINIGEDHKIAGTTSSPIFKHLACASKKQVTELYVCSCMCVKVTWPGECKLLVVCPPCIQTSSLKKSMFPPCKFTF